MDRSQVSRIAHSDHPIAAPVTAERARALLRRALPSGAATMLDLGCGAGEWLVMATEVRADCTGVGIDLSAEALDEARATADLRGKAARLTWVQADASEWSGGTFDTVVCVGASHAFGGLDGTLAAIRRHLRPGGSAVLGDGIWEVPPSAAAQRVLEASPDDLPDLAGLVDRVRAEGFDVSVGHVSTLRDWDDYEWSWTGSLVDWALSGAGTPKQREEALSAASDHRDDWLRGYRGQLGFATLVLRDIGPDGPSEPNVPEE